MVEYLSKTLQDSARRFPLLSVMSRFADLLRSSTTPPIRSAYTRWTHRRFGFSLPICVAQGQLGQSVGFCRVCRDRRAKVVRAPWVTVRVQMRLLNLPITQDESRFVSTQIYFRELVLNPPTVWTLLESPDSPMILVPSMAGHLLSLKCLTQWAMLNLG